jgi:3D (Asp-Asp-Asp) domain-containing protein
MAFAVVGLAVGSAVLTKRTLGTPGELGSKIANQLREHDPNLTKRDWVAIPAVSLVDAPLPSQAGTTTTIIDPLIGRDHVRPENAVAFTVPASVFESDASSSSEDATSAAHSATSSASEHATGPAVSDGHTPRLVTPPAGYERYFNGRPLRRAGTMTMRVTAYSPDYRSCGPNAKGITASGMSVWTNGMNLVAADPRVLPRNSLVSVPGYAEDSVVPVLDVGGAIKGNRLDVLYPSHDVALRWGVRDLEVTIWEYADE